jgi:hypothetical protein
MHRPVLYLVAAVALLVVASPAIAYVCHPDPTGAKSLALRGRVVAYGLQGTTLTIVRRSGGRCVTTTWRSSDGRSTSAPSSCAAAAAMSRPVGAPAHLRVIRPGTADRAERLQVLERGRVVRSWPLPVRVRPGTLQVRSGLAAFVGRGNAGLWVVRLADGRGTLVSPVRSSDRPLLGRAGIAFQDYVYKRRPADRPLMTFLPKASLGWELSRVGRPLHTGGRIKSFSMDGTRVALVVAGRGGDCDRVVLWNIPWRSVDQVSEKAGPTCASTGASRRITDVALGGSRAQWVTQQRGRPMLVAADDIACQEWVIRRLADGPHGISLAGIAADGPNLAFALARTRNGSAVSRVGRITGLYRGRNVSLRLSRVVGLSASSWRVAVLSRDGLVAVENRAGRLVRSLRVHGATSIALGRDRLAVVTRSGRLGVYSLATGRRIHEWRLPAGAGHVDLQYGIAVVTARRSVYAVHTATGRTAKLATAPARVRAQIESMGIVYAYSVGRRGTARLVPMSRVEAAVR